MLIFAFCSLDEGRGTEGIFQWDFEGPSNGYIDGVSLEMISYSASTIPGVVDNAMLLDGATQGVNLGAFEGTCASSIDSCVGNSNLTVSFYLRFQRQIYLEKSIITTSLDDIYSPGFYLKYHNINEDLPLRFYFEVAVITDVLGIDVSNGALDLAVWTVPLNLETSVWTHLHIDWSSEGGLIVYVDGILAGFNNSPISETASIWPSEPSSILLGYDTSTDGHHAQLMMDQLTMWDEVDAPHPKTTIIQGM